MTARNDLDARIAAWVSDLPSHAPDGILEPVLAELPAVSQQGRLRAAARRTFMQTTFRGRTTSISAPMAAIAALAVVVLVGGLFLSRFSDPGVGNQPTATPSPAVSGSPSPSALQFEAIEVGAPLVVATNSDAAWASSMTDGVVRIDLATNETTVISLPQPPEDLRGIAATDEAVWQADLGNNTVYRIDPATNQVVASIEMPRPPLQPYPVGNLVYVDMEGGSPTMESIDPNTNEIRAQLDAIGTIAFGSVWLGGVPQGHVSRYEIETGRVTEIEVPIPSAICEVYPLSGVEGLRDTISTGCPDSPYRTLIDVATNEVLATYDVGAGTGASIAAAGGWWTIVGDNLARVDPATGAILDLRALEGNVPTPVRSTMATSANDLWIASEATEQVIRIPFAELAAR